MSDRVETELLESLIVNFKAGADQVIEVLYENKRHLVHKNGLKIFKALLSS